MPVRKIPKNYRNVTGIAAHRKSNGPAMFESTLERDFISLLEFDPTVKTFEVQPLSLDWLDANGKSHRYTPDVLASFKSHQGCQEKILYEVKYRSELRRSWLEIKPKLRAAVHFARTQGWRFKIVTEIEIRTPYLDNAKFLLPFIKRGPVEESHMDLIDECLHQLCRTTPAELLAAIFQDQWNQASLIPSLWYLIGTRQIGVDLSSKLTMVTPIWSRRK